MPQYVKWNNTWKGFYIKNLKDFARQECQTHGQSDELDVMLPALSREDVPDSCDLWAKGRNQSSPFSSMAVSGVATLLPTQRRAKPLPSTLQFCRLTMNVRVYPPFRHNLCGADVYKMNLLPRLCRDIVLENRGRRSITSLVPSAILKRTMKIGRDFTQCISDYSHPRHWLIGTCRHCHFCGGALQPPKRYDRRAMVEIVEMQKLLTTKCL